MENRKRPAGETAAIILSVIAAAALVIGNEGRGLGRLIREKCDCILSLPMSGHINSLNASVAAGVLMYEFARQRQDF